MNVNGNAAVVKSACSESQTQTGKRGYITRGEAEKKETYGRSEEREGL